ncbi:oxidoreductase [Leifsonia xyli subsp. cynodontis DSM 46306]|uniref:Uncharacterized protein n=1 Tax=Leifsonia xyli subsp. cynodontis DSM 46306 TaxID=1389489 RepID=U3PA41_LEIXC|nr:hypothetical protein [Leifsonia xyli]AGW41707.1 oxidoreductase [Leifsonia xyli subsp. cynodontis DSM 46306]
MASRVRIKPGLLKRLRDIREIPSEDHQARLMGFDRTTLRRIDAGGVPSAAFMAAMWETFGLGLGEAFEFVENESLCKTERDVETGMVATELGMTASEIVARAERATGEYVRTEMAA